MTTKCDSRCTGARGGSCDCECGGINHGGETRGQNAYFLSDQWVAVKEDGGWFAVHKDGFVSPPVKSLEKLREMQRDGRLDTFHDAKTSRSGDKRPSQYRIVGEGGTVFGPMSLPRDRVQREADLLTAETGVMHRVEEVG